MGRATRLTSSGATLTISASWKFALECSSESKWIEINYGRIGKRRVKVPADNGAGANLINPISSSGGVMRSKVSRRDQTEQ